MIDLGESQVFEGHVAQTSHGIIRRELAASNILEELANGFGVQRVSAVGIQPGTMVRLAFCAAGL
jgi:hypothetical protein